jgi:hypothetical protein
MSNVPAAASIHPDCAFVLKYFAYSHLPLSLQQVSSHFCELAQAMVDHWPADSPAIPEVVAGLRKLLEAKDCFVRAAVFVVEKSDA